MRKTLQPTRGPATLSKTLAIINFKTVSYHLLPVTGLPTNPRKRRADLRRIVACWNYFQGISTNDIIARTDCNDPVY